MSEEGELEAKARRMLRALLIESSSQPGMRGWELRRAFGKSYQQIVKVADAEAERLGLRIATVPDDEAPEDIDRARFVLVTKEPLTEFEASRWLRIEEAASLAILIGEMAIRGGAITTDAAVKLLSQKLPRWRINQILSKLKRLGYIKEENGIIMKDWRTKVEIDEAGFLRDITSPQGQ